MEAGKPQRRTSIFDYWSAKKRVKLTEEPISTPKAPVARLEDLPTELFYEVFGYLDVYHVYQAFYHLNLRLRSLLTDSTLPMKISVESMSRSTFQRYHRHIIMPNKHRITSMHLFNPFVVDLIFSPVRIVSYFTRLETLVLDRIKSKYLANILHRLAVLPNLTSLTIVPIDFLSNRNHIFERILRLPALKHCKMSLRDRFSSNELSISPAVTSRLEQLIIEHGFDLDRLSTLLPHVPQLRRLTCRSLDQTHNAQLRPIPVGLNVLTHVSFTMMNMPFDRFESLIKNLFRQLQVLRISTGADDGYLNANRWQHLITSFMPQLRIFDLEHSSSSNDGTDFIQATYESILNQFSSLFWREQKWFFGYQCYAGTYRNQTVFYSTNPYRREQYTLSSPLTPKARRLKKRNDMPLVKHLTINNEKAMTSCDVYFRHAKQLTLANGFRTSRVWLRLYFKFIMPLNQLTTLVIDCPNFAFEQLTNLLHATPNTHTLTYSCATVSEVEVKSIQQSFMFRSVASTNRITKLTMTGMFSLESTEIFVGLCPRMQRLTIDQYRGRLEASLRYIISKCTTDLQQLCLICTKCTTKSTARALKTLIDSEGLLNNYVIKQINFDFYFWW